MPQTKRKATQKSIRDEDIERAIRTTHEEFERALVAEWNTRSDGATIVNAMAVQPYRCRKCGKPTAGMGEICACKGTINQVRCVLNPRDTLRELFQQRCRGIVSSVSLGEFVESVSTIAIAHDRDLPWVEDQIQRLLPSLTRTFRKWIISILPLPFKHTDLLPAWFKDELEVIPDSDLQQSLSADDTVAELAHMEVEIKRHFEEATKAGLDQANLRMVQVARFDLTHVATRQPRPDLTAAMVATVKRDYPGISIEQVCQILDGKHWPLREIDKRPGFKTWHDAWKDPQHRNRIKRFISQIRPAAAQREV